MNKKCTKCNTDKPLTDYYPHKKGKFGFRPVCKSCEIKYRKRYNIKNKDKLTKYSKLYQINNKSKIKDRKLFKTYGITLHDYNLMLKHQNNKCLVCKNKFDKNNIPYVDHDHSNSKVRGLLCNGCNIALGWVNDDIDILNSLINYLQLSRASITSEIKC